MCVCTYTQKHIHITLNGFRKLYCVYICMYIYITTIIKEEVMNLSEGAQEEWEEKNAVSTVLIYKK